MVKLSSSAFILAAAAAVQGAAIGKDTDVAITPYANEAARVEGTFEARIKIGMASTSICRLIQNGKTIFSTSCGANDFSGQKCSNCVSNDNLKLCVDQGGCSLYDSNGWKFWSQKWMTLTTKHVPCKDGKPGAGCSEIKGSLSADVRI